MLAVAERIMKLGETSVRECAVFPSEEDNSKILRWLSKALETVLNISLYLKSDTRLLEREIYEKLILKGQTDANCPVAVDLHQRENRLWHIKAKPTIPDEEAVRKLSALITVVLKECSKTYPKQYNMRLHLPYAAALTVMGIFRKLSWPRDVGLIIAKKVRDDYPKPEEFVPRLLRRNA
ncbi:MAG TPA: hypothetical protein VGV92_02910 [Gammaproteobacteria bacterium]|nr:hypothetical protein [Gammaproteobacteria bacterium]